MSNKLSTLGYWKLRFFSKPIGDRCLYQFVSAAKPTSIVEIGLTSIERSRNLIRIAQKFSQQKTIKFCGIDLFEGRAASVPGMSLKEVHRELQKTEAKIRLMPGDFGSTVPRVANQLGQNDLIIVTTTENHEALTPTWYYLPRMMQDFGTVFLRASTSAEIAYEKLSFKDINRLAERRTELVRNAA